jgi:hypothetical protein
MGSKAADLRRQKKLNRDRKRKLDERKRQMRAEIAQKLERKNRIRKILGNQ